MWRRFPYIMLFFTLSLHVRTILAAERTRGRRGLSAGCDSSSRSYLAGACRSCCLLHKGISSWPGVNNVTAKCSRSASWWASCSASFRWPTGYCERQRQAAGKRCGRSASAVAWEHMTTYAPRYGSARTSGKRVVVRPPSNVEKLPLSIPPDCDGLEMGKLPFVTAMGGHDLILLTRWDGSVRQVARSASS